MSEGRLRRLTTDMRALQGHKEAIEASLKEVNKALDQLRLKDIPDLMAEMDIRTVTFDGVGRIQLAADCYVTILDKEAGYVWLSKHGYDGIIQPYVQPSTLKATIKEAIKQSQEFPPELFNISPFVRASIVGRG